MSLRPSVRLRTAAVAVAVLGAVLGGCGDDDSSSPLADPTPSDPTTAATSEAAASDEDQLRELVASYQEALARVQETRAEDETVFAGVLTDDLATTYLGNYRDNIYGKGLEMTGRWTLAVESVDVEGDRASVETCLDGREVYVVEAGQGIGGDDQPQGLTPTTVEAVRTSGTWLVSSLTSEEGTCSPA